MTDIEHSGNLTYWNPSNEHPHTGADWFSYLRGPLLAKYAATSVGLYIQQSTTQQVQAVDAIGRKICGGLFVGFSKLESQLKQVSGKLDEISSQLEGVSDALQSIDGRLTLMLDEAKTSNLLQENIAELLRIPDSQKQRQHHVEMGLKFLKNALKDEDLYQDALSELLAAEKLLPSDYFVLHRIGMIYLYVPALGNLEKAADIFVRAGKYASVESDPDAVRLSNILNKQVSKRFKEQPDVTPNDINTLAAESYLQAANAFYALSRFSEAVKMAEKAVKLQPEEAKHRFFFAKYLTRSGDSNAAVPQLQKAVELAPEMALGAVADFDLNSAKPILDLLNHLDDEATFQARTALKILDNWPPTEQERYQEAKKLVATLQSALENGNYVEKLSLVTRLKHIRQSAEIAAFGIPATLRLAWTLPDASEAAIGDDGAVYFGAKGGVIAVDSRTGKELWSYGTGSSSVGAPAIGADGRVYFVCHGLLAALDGKTGNMLWHFEAKGHSISPPAIGADGTIYFGSDYEGVIALKGKTGKKLWQFSSQAHFYAPAIGADGIVFIGSSDKGLLALDAQTGKVLWNYEARGHIVSAAAIGADGTIYVASSDKGVLALNGQTGTALWNFETGGYNISAPAIGADGTVYVGQPVLALDGKTGKLLWKFETTGESVAIGADGAVYVGSENGVVALDGRTGKVLWEFETGAGASCPTIGPDGTVWVATKEGVCAIWTASGCWADSSWPMSRQNSRRTGMSKEAAAAYITNLPARMERARLAAETKQRAEAEAKMIQENIQRLLSEADAVAAVENSKWLRKKDFSHARELYSQAAELGSEKAAEKLKELPS